MQLTISCVEGADQQVSAKVRLPVPLVFEVKDGLGNQVVKARYQARILDVTEHKSLTEGLRAAWAKSVEDETNSKKDAEEIFGLILDQSDTTDDPWAHFS